MSNHMKNTSIYTTKPGDSLSGISMRELGDIDRWKEIQKLNIDRFPLTRKNDYYPVGTDLIMPDDYYNSNGDGCGYSSGDWECRSGGYLWDAGTGEGYDPEDCTYICPHCRTQDFLEDAKEEAESCSYYSNCGVSGTGLTIWKSSEREALQANKEEALKALLVIGIVSALDGDDIVLCNTEQK